MSSAAFWTSAGSTTNLEVTILARRSLQHVYAVRAIQATYSHFDQALAASTLRSGKVSRGFKRRRSRCVPDVIVLGIQELVVRLDHVTSLIFRDGGEILLARNEADEPLGIESLVVSLTRLLDECLWRSPDDSSDNLASRLRPLTACTILVEEVQFCFPEREDPPCKQR